MVGQYRFQGNNVGIIENINCIVFEGTFETKILGQKYKL